MGKISKALEQRRQQARIAAAQAQLDAAVAFGMGRRHDIQQQSGRQRIEIAVEQGRGDLFPERGARGDVGVIRVGERHKYVFDWDPDGADYGFWIQRLVTSIDYVEAEELAGLPAFPQDDPL